MPSKQVFVQYWMYTISQWRPMTIFNKHFWSFHSFFTKFEKEVLNFQSGCGYWRKILIARNKEIIKKIQNFLQLWVSCSFLSIHCEPPLVYLTSGYIMGNIYLRLLVSMLIGLWSSDWSNSLNLVESHNRLACHVCTMHDQAVL